MATFKLEIITPERTIFSGDVAEAVLPTAEGEIGVLPHHIPLVSLLKAGEVRIKQETGEFSMAVSGGFIEVRPDKVVVLADSAERAEEIDEARAEAARQAAQRLIAEKRADTEEFTALAAKMEKELARLRVVRKRKHGRPDIQRL